MTPKKNLLPIITVAIFSFAIVSFLVYYFMTNKNTPTENTETNQPNEEIIPTSAPEITPTEAPKPTVAEIDKKIKIQVLNATDINGQAATLKAKLVALGFTNVSVGNATATATENAVSAKSASISAYFESALADYFPGEYTEDLKTTSTYDAVFTIGSDLSKSSTSTSTTIKTTVTPTKAATATPTKKVTATPTVEE